MRIRKVKQKDINNIFKLEQQIFQDDAFSKDLIKKLIKTNTFFLKLEKGFLNKILIGFIIIIKDSSDRANIINFLIDPLYQHKGWGSYFLKYSIQKIKKLNYINKIILNVKVDNENAINLYEKFFFKKVQEIKNYYRTHDNSYLMELNV